MLAVLGSIAGRSIEFSAAPEIRLPVVSSGSERRKLNPEELG